MDLPLWVWLISIVCLSGVVPSTWVSFAINPAKLPTTKAGSSRRAVWVGLSPTYSFLPFLWWCGKRRCRPSQNSVREQQKRS